jgi:hypothetical protein
MKIGGLTLSSSTLKMEATFFCETFLFAEETIVAQPRTPILRFAAFMHLSEILYYQKECAMRTTNLTTECLATEGSDSSILGDKD